MGLAKDNVTAWDANKIVLKSGTSSNLLASMMDKKVLDDFKNYDISPINLARVVAYKNSNESKENIINITMIGLNQNSKAYPERNKPENSNQVLASNSLKKVREKKKAILLLPSAITSVLCMRHYHIAYPPSCFAGLSV